MIVYYNFIHIYHFNINNLINHFIKRFKIVTYSYGNINKVNMNSSFFSSFQSFSFHKSNKNNEKTHIYTHTHKRKKEKKQYNTINYTDILITLPKLTISVEKMSVDLLTFTGTKHVKLLSIGYGQV